MCVKGVQRYAWGPTAATGSSFFFKNWSATNLEHKEIDKQHKDVKLVHDKIGVLILKQYCTYN